MWYILSADYDGNNRCVFLRLYNSETNKIRKWLCADEFMPYLLTDATIYEIERVMLDKLYDELEQVEKFDALNDKHVIMTKVKSLNPLNIGGRNYDPKVLKYAIPERIEGRTTWENDIPTFISYIIDKDVKMGMPHRISGNKLELIIDEQAEKRVKELMETLFADYPNKDVLERWIHILEYPAPEFRRLAVDIEVLNEEKRIPNSEQALQPVICVCVMDNKGRKIAFVLNQYKGLPTNIPEDAEIRLFSNEKELFVALFKEIGDYPFIITFNGDEFDLKYLLYRALNLGMSLNDIPIIHYKKTMTFKNAIHIDLYRFFKIKSIQTYSFKGKYKNVDLDTIGISLLGKGKLKGEYGWVAEMTIDELIAYCFRDVEITMELTTYDNNLVMNLILALTRISKLPIENVSRQSISRWIKNYMYYEHRQRGFLIPKKEDILKIKGGVATIAKIKGKKYQGAIVVEPKAGTHFNVAVLDFPSLYPSIIKDRNLGYQTINCKHEECKSNTVPTTPHWVCTKEKAIESIFVGTVRDLRVKWYKQQAKENTPLKAWYSVVEQSLKVIMNASYGVFGAESFSLYCPPVAEATTAYGRNYIISSSNKSEELGMEVDYGDTDSLFLGKWTDDKISQLNAWVGEHFDIEMEKEKVYRFLCLSNRKKNYVGVTTKGDVDVKGMTLKKKHTPAIIREAGNQCKTILKEVHNKEEFEVARSKIGEIVLGVYQILKQRNYELEDLAFHVNLGKEPDAYGKEKKKDDGKTRKGSIPQHVKAARMLQDEGYEVTIGQTITFIKTRKRIKLKKSWKWEDDVKPIELATNEDVNLDKYIEFLRSTFEQLLDPLDISFDSLLGIKKLTAFMG